jgi:predicted short-subunit dehydrogenase-like oxidoreductase (DUF2520 family)
LASQPLRRISLIGAGKVGTALVVRLYRSGYKIASVISQSRSSAKHCARLVRCSRFSNHLADVAPVDLYLIAVPDDRIGEVARTLATLQNFSFESSIVVHTSGSLTSDELAPLKHRGARVCSLHPLQTFPADCSVDEQVEALQGITYSYEGPSSLIGTIRKVTRAIGGRLIVIPKEEKILYHIACVMASNYVVATLGAAESLFPLLPPRQARSHLRRLVESSVANALAISPLKALTGPVSRGDVAVVRRHLQELERQRKELLPLYRALGLQSLRLAARRLAPAAVRRLEEVLSKTNAR